MKFRAEAIAQYLEKYLDQGMSEEEAYKLAEIDAWEAYEAACEAKMDAKREDGF